MPLDLEKYLEVTKPLTISLSQGEELKIEYIPRRMTGNRLKAASELQRKFFEKLRDNAKRNMPAKREEGDESEEEVEYDDFDDQQQIILVEQFAAHLSSLIVSCDIKIGKRPVPFGTPDERYAILSQLDFDDLKIINAAIVEDIANPTKSAGTSSSDGQPAKGDEPLQTDSNG